MSFRVRIEVTVWEDNENLDEIFHNSFSVRAQDRESAILYGERMMNHSRHQTVDCLGCGKQIDYRQGTCPHCGRKEF